MKPSHQPHNTLAERDPPHHSCVSLLVSFLKLFGRYSVSSTVCLFQRLCGFCEG